MRWFCAILALYVFALSVQPCSDANKDGHEQCSVQTEGEQHEHMDLCSPFCTCTCCAGITLLKVDHFQRVLPTRTLVYTEGTATVLSMPRIPVWQPPQA